MGKYIAWTYEMLHLLSCVLNVQIWSLLLHVVPAEGGQPCTFSNAGSVSVIYCESDCCDNTCCTNTDEDSSVAVVVLSVLAAVVLIAVVVVVVVVWCKHRLPCRRGRRDKRPITVSPAQDKPRSIDKPRPYNGWSVHNEKPTQHDEGAMYREGTFSIFA
ncbi:uncharacterized protein LOC124117383 [Haliotis rufescens]|uniref:uncharacterized protein LOC124117383 n=1 Tax=Haliotis rufescens TaxID=6454 RepID=UPI00201EE589|nr:uncharacterized protein LOC124117383 [Haliotis rufescens]